MISGAEGTGRASDDSERRYLSRSTAGPASPLEPEPWFSLIRSRTDAHRSNSAG